MALWRGKPVKGTSRSSKIRIACEPCRQRKSKCDGLHPCTACFKLRRDCFYSSLPPGLDLLNGSRIASILRGLESDSLAASKPAYLSAGATSDALVLHYLQPLTQELPFESEDLETPVPGKGHVARSGAFLDDNICLPRQSTALRLIDLVFNHNSAYMQFFHKPSLILALNALYARADPELHVASVLPDPGLAQSLPVIFLFFEIGIRYAQEMHSDDESYQSLCGVRYMELAKLILASIKGVSLWILQGHLMLAFHDMVFSMLWSASDKIYMALQVTFKLGLHSQQNLKDMSCLEAEISKRALWTLFFFDRYVHSALGIPLLLDASCISQDLPAGIDDEFLYENAIDASSQTHPSRQAAFNSLVSLMQIVGDISLFYQHFNPLKSLDGSVIRDKFLCVCRFERTLNDWHSQKLPVHIRYPIQDLRYNRQAFMLEISFLWAQMILMRPFYAIKPHIANADVDLLSQRCINYAKRTIQVIRELQQYRKIHCGYFMSLRCITTALWIALYSPSRGLYANMQEDIAFGLQTVGSMATHSRAAERLYEALKRCYENLDKSAKPLVTGTARAKVLRRSLSFSGAQERLNGHTFEIDNILEPVRLELNLNKS